MIADGVRFEGFDAPAWGRLLSLISPAPAPSGEDAAARPSGLLVVVAHEGHALSAFTTKQGPVDVGPRAELELLPELCAQHGVGRGVLLEAGTLEEMAERAARHMAPDADYVTQWLSVLGAIRDLETEGRIAWWPARRHLPLPSPAMVRRAFDLILPDERAMVLAIWEEQTLWTALALRRRAGNLDWIVGPEQLAEWTGPLGGDFRRDHRIIQRAVARTAAPLHLGVFTQRRTLEALLRSGEAGSWAKAVAVREVIISPSPRYISAAVAADALRAAAQTTGRWLGGSDLVGFLTPALRRAREQVGDAGSLTRILGFNPLGALASRLSRSSDEPRAS